MGARERKMEQWERSFREDERGRERQRKRERQRERGREREREGKAWAEATWMRAF
jgi:hypothetical protein